MDKILSYLKINRHRNGDILTIDQCINALMY